jgi:predicted anti-sigma-YlaC factor YlaD
VSWSHLKNHVGTEEYELISSNLTSKSIKLAHQMPFSVTINRGMLESCYSMRDIAGIMGVVSMFQSFLPSLIIDGEYLRRIIS